MHRMDTLSGNLPLGPRPRVRTSAALVLYLAACGGGTGQDTGDTDGSTDPTAASSGASEPTGEAPTSGTDDTGASDFDPIEATLEDVKQQVAAGPVACTTLVARYEELFTARDPQITAMIGWNTEAQARAEALDAVPVDQRGPLHCAPIVVKDNIDVAGLPTSGGVAALADSRPPADAPIVARLLDAGAVILGKTNMPDFATNGIDTNSSAGGRTLNPYDLTSTVYGSSGGSAAAIAASLGIVALGSDTFGSLIQPSSATALVAIRSTQGLVPGAGILPLMTLQDVAGPMARNVADAAAVLAVIADRPDLAAAQGPDGLQGLVLGHDPMATEPIAILGTMPDPAVGALFSAALADITAAGATTPPVDALFGLFGSLQPAIDGSFACMPVDFKQGFSAYLQSLGPDAPVKTLAELIAGGAYLPDVDGFLMGADAQTDAVADSAACQDYLAAKMAARAAVTGFMDDEGLDLMVFPATNQFPFLAGENPPAGWFGYHPLSSVTGLPSLVMPLGHSADTGLPVGLVLLARPDREDLLIQAASAIEQARPVRVPPTLP